MISTVEDGLSSAVEFHDVLDQMPTQPVTPIGLQAQEIIDSILDDPAPGLAEVQYRLREYVAAYPGFPERALLAHLMETSEDTNSEADEGPAY
ncbi:hypothetical protein QFZ30_003960 [Arthrobacter pascens]|uniref:hypothetical protein n=1 Tax=Arthrobacter pascens TaxID=1677 RepID=UPI00278F7C26|nr:hypothetical protein [Arthrobacter pascens]MDQ0680578.1 hypothetical protein [Arthrobacter pascens]